MTQVLENTKFQPVYLHYMFEKFLEIQVDPDNLTTVIRKGKLTSSGLENIPSIQTQEQPHNTWEEAVQCANKHIALANSQGYQAINKEDIQNEECSSPSTDHTLLKKPRTGKRRNNHDLPRVDSKRLKMSSNNKSFSEFEAEEASLLSDQFQTNADILSDMFRRQTPTQDNKTIRKMISLRPERLDIVEELTQKCGNLDVGCRVYGDKVILSGEPVKVQAAEDFFKQNLDSTSIEYETNESPVQKEIQLSPFMRTMKNHISSKATQLNLSYEFVGDFIEQKLIVEGTHSAIMDLLGYLLELESLSSKQRSEKKDYEALFAKLIDTNRILSKSFEEVERKVNVINLRLTVNSEDSIQKEVRLMKTMAENLGDIKARLESIQLGKLTQTSRGPSQEEAQKMLILSDCLIKVKEKLDTLGTKVENQLEEMSQNELEMIKYVSEDLKNIKNMFEDFEKKNRDSDKENQVKLEKSITNGFGMISRKIEEMDDWLSSNLGGSQHKETKICNSLAEVSKQVDGLRQIMMKQEQKIEKKFSSLTKMIEAIAVIKPQVAEESRYSQREISISLFHRGMIKEIHEKAHELELFLDLTYDISLTAGPLKNLEKFILFLQECEVKVKKSLYPKNWDFLESERLIKIPIPQNTQEYKEVASLFHMEALKDRKIVKLERIQNKNLIENYIMIVQKKQELRQVNSLKRTLLFHWTAPRNPEVIYKSEDIGFGTSPKKGIVFTSKSVPDALSMPYKTPRNTFQVLIADVLLGNVKVSDGEEIPNEEYDCVMNKNSGNYTIYNNFQSYPLYLLEYTSN